MDPLIEQAIEFRWTAFLFSIKLCRTQIPTFSTDKLI